MFSYVYMKILESQPHRYDRGISLVSFGRSERMKHTLVSDNVHSNDSVLEIGCGTGTAAILAAKRGAHVVGFDISNAMLTVAREKVSSEQLNANIELIEMPVSEMDRFPDQGFDVVFSTLVFSELSKDEQEYTLAQSYRILRPGGVLALADEVQPRSIWKRLLHGAVRIPMAIITFILTQTSTSAVYVSFSI